MSADKTAKTTTSSVLYVLGVIAAVLIVAAFAPSETKLTIAIHQGVEGVALKQVIAKFAAETKIPVDVIELPYEQLFAAEIEQIKSQPSAYDVVMADDPWMPALINADPPNKELLKPINLPQETCNRIGDFVPALLQVSREPYSEAELKCSDKFYALPFVGNSQLFAFRKVQESGTPLRLPKNWREATEDPGYVMRVGPGNPIVTDFMPMLWEVSKDIFPAEPGKTLSLPPEAERAFGYLSTLGNRPENLGIISYDDFDLAIQLASGQAKMSIVWSAWAMAMAHLPKPQRTRLFDEIGFDQIPGAQPELGAWLLAIPTTSAHPKEANDFIVFATRNDQLREAAKIGNPPPIQSLLRDEELKGLYPWFEAQRTSLMNARPRPRTRHWASIEQVLGRCLSVAYESALISDSNDPAVRAAQVPEANRKLVDRSNAAIQAVQSGQPIDSFSCMKD